MKLSYNVWVRRTLRSQPGVAVEGWLMSNLSLTHFQAQAPSYTFEEALRVAPLAELDGTEVLQVRVVEKTHKLRDRSDGNWDVYYPDNKEA